MQRGRWIGLGQAFAGYLVVVSAQGQSAPTLPSEVPASHFELGLHARSMKASMRAEQSAWLMLTVPFDRLAAPRAVTASVPAAPPSIAPQGAAASPPSTAPNATASEPLAPSLGFKELVAFSDFTRRAIAAALAAAGAGADRGRLDSLSSRAKASALLPELRLRIVRNTDQALRWVPTTDDPYRVTQADGAGLILEAGAVFRLDRLVFAHEELAVERLRQRAAEERLKLEAHVAQSLLELLRARQLACSLDPNDPGRIGHVLKLLELFELLDSLTAGWFAGQAPGLGRAVWGFPEAILGECQPPEPVQPPSEPAATNPVATFDDSE
ncbi:MAG TPA: hypothetical protein VHB79_29425 [Polyangiaceae bacterium]|nr:hypothetical protein [Polyangiaceae bacterium]